MKREWSVYIALCADATLYTGITRSVEERLRAHNEGRGARYTRGRRPVRLLYRAAGFTRRGALRREHAIKKLSRREKLLLAGGRLRVRT